MHATRLTVVRLRCFFLVLGLTMVAMLPAPALTFSYTEGSGMAALRAGDAGQQALAQNVADGFASAGNLWSASLTNSITINLRIDFQSLGAGVIGSTSPIKNSASYSSVKTALTSHATSSLDFTVVANLQAGTSMVFQTNRSNPTAAVYTPSAGLAITNSLDVARANLKALGLITANNSANDADITLGSGFSFDFDRSDGITLGQTDFVGVAAREIGHSLGFASGVDGIDLYSGTGPNSGSQASLDGFRIFTVLDIFRYSSTGVRDLTTGGTPYFSVDNGVTSLGLFDTGKYNGDGQSAGNLGTGLMGPPLAPDTLGEISTQDRNAVDAIGYTVVPEPSTIALLAMGLGLVTLAWRRRFRSRPLETW